MKAEPGFTLIEVVTALTVASVLAMVALPAFSGVLARSRAAEARTALAATLLDAVRHAGNSGSEVVLCPSRDASTCDDSWDWSQGWVAFADPDRNRVRGASEAVVHAERALSPRTRLISTPGRRRMVFQPSGGNAGSNITFTLCDRRNAVEPISLVISNAGHLRQTTASALSAQACTSG